MCIRDRYVYSDGALKLWIDGEEAPASLEMTNVPQISGLYEEYEFEVAQKKVLDMERDINLKRMISINYGDYAWGALCDRVKWAETDGREKGSVATVNYNRGGLYENIEYFDRSSYAPTDQFILSGPVSYTHLDVYKRQKLECRIPLDYNTTGDDLPFTAELWWKDILLLGKKADGSVPSTVFAERKDFSIVPSTDFAEYAGKKTLFYQDFLGKSLPKLSLGRKINRPEITFQQDGDFKWSSGNDTVATSDEKGVIFLTGKSGEVDFCLLYTSRCV